MGPTPADLKKLGGAKKIQRVCAKSPRYNARCRQNFHTKHKIRHIPMHKNYAHERAIAHLRRIPIYNINARCVLSFYVMRKTNGLFPKFGIFLCTKIMRMIYSALTAYSYINKASI